MADRYQHQIMPSLIQKLRVNRSTLWRRQLKEKDPEKYRRYLEQQRVRSQVARNRLKLAISMVKNSPMKGMKFDRQKKLTSDKNSSGPRRPQLINFSNNEKTDEPKIVLDKLPHQIKIFKMFHILSSGVHLKFAQTLARISVQYYWPTMREDVNKWVSDCIVCGNQSTHTKKNIVVQSDGSTSWQFSTSLDLDGNGGSWSKESTKILLQAVAEIFGRRSLHFQTELELWTEIAKTVNLHGTSVSAVTCKLKWQEMKKLYLLLKTETKLSPKSSQSWPLYNVMDMVYKAFQTLTKETNIPPKFPFTSIFEVTETDMNELSNSELISDSQIDQSNFPLNIYRNVYHNSSSLHNNEVAQINSDQNLELTEICEKNAMTEREEKNNFDLFDSSLKAVGRQYWNTDQIHPVSQDSFCLDTNVDNSVSNLMLPLPADFNATVDAITASELQHEIKQECSNLVQNISFPSEQGNSVYVDNNHPKHDAITLKMELDETVENLQVQANSKSCYVLKPNRTRNAFSDDDDILCLDIVARESGNNLNSNQTKVSLSSGAKMNSLNQDIQSSNHDLNTVDLTYLSPEPDKDSISFPEDQGSMVTSSKDDENDNLCTVTPNPTHRHTNKNNIIEEELSSMKHPLTNCNGNSLSPVSLGSVCSNVISLGNSRAKNEDIPIWFQEYLKEQKHHATEQEKQMKDFQDSLLGLVRETNQHLATLIYIQRNEMKNRDKKDDDFKNTLFELIKEKWK